MTCIAMLGGSGRLGRHIVESLLLHGYQIRALAHRQPLSCSQPNLTVVAGDVRDPAIVQELLQGATAVVSSLGSAQAAVPNICSTAATHLIPAMRARGIERVIATTGSAAREDREIGSEPPHLLARRGALMAHMSGLILDGEALLREFTASSLAWTVLRLPRMTFDDERAAQLASIPPAPTATIGYRAAALAIVGELLQPTWIGQAPFVAPASSD